MRHAIAEAFVERQIGGEGGVGQQAEFGFFGLPRQRFGMGEQMLAKAVTLRFRRYRDILDPQVIGSPSTRRDVRHANSAIAPLSA